MTTPPRPIMVNNGEQIQISKDEVALYDRQIRLWGLEAQNRLHNSKILVINIGAVANEVVKNIVLAGIGSLTILDSHTVLPKHLGAQFFLDQSDIGANRGEAVKIKIQRLNPRVAIETDGRTLDQVESGWLEQFDIVVATELDYDQLIYVNGITRKSSKSFFAAGLFGLYGYVFADLVEHKFNITRDRATVHTVIGPETATRSIVDIQTSRQGNSLRETLTKIEKYKSLEDVVANVYEPSTASFGSSFRTRKLLKISPILPALLGLWKSASASSSFETFKESTLESARALGLPAGIITDKFISQFYNSINTEISPVAAVVGGVLGQDILNVLASREQPIQNLFLFDGSTSEGPIYAI